MQRRWHNRANWACYDLYRAGLLDRPKRGLYIITEAGKQLAVQKPQVIDRDFLMKYPQFVQFAQSTSTKKSIKTEVANTEQENDPSTKSKTPEELIIQRQFIWDADDVRDLIDSIVNGYTRLYNT